MKYKIVYITKLTARLIFFFRLTNNNKVVYAGNNMKKLIRFLFLFTPFLFAAPAHAIKIGRDPNIIRIVDIGSLVGSIAGVLIIVGAIIAFVYLIWGGLQWITSGGDKAGLETARGRITNAIIGLIIVAAAWAIMWLVGRFIGVDILGGNIPLPKAHLKGEDSIIKDEDLRNILNNVQE